MLLSLTIIAVAVVVLYHMLRDIDVDDVIDAHARRPIGAR